MGTTETKTDRLESYTTRGGIKVHRTAEEVATEGAIDGLIESLDSRRGVLLASSYEYPGRYTRWDLGFVNPPLMLSARDREFAFQALNERGRVLLSVLAPVLQKLPAVVRSERSDSSVTGSIEAPKGWFPEEERSRQPSVFSLLRAVVDCFSSESDPHLGLYGAFGYDLAFQFEPMRLRLSRAADRARSRPLPPRRAHRRRPPARKGYAVPLRLRGAAGDRRAGCRAMAKWPRTRDARACRARAITRRASTRQVVREAREAFRRGDLFEVVPGQTFFEPCPVLPSELFRRLRERNPAPYGFLINLGAGRVPGRRLARDVRARRRRARRDVPDLGHDRARHAIRSPTPPRSWSSSTRRRTSPSSRCARTSIATTSRASATREACA